MGVGSLLLPYEALGVEFRLQSLVDGTFTAHPSSWLLFHIFETDSHYVAHGGQL